MVRLLTLGETLGVAWTDVGDPLRTAATLRLSIAGAESTVAVGMRRLGHDAVWVGVVGADPLGARVRRQLAAEQVDVRFVREAPGAATGFMLRDRATREHLTVTYYRRDSAGCELRADDVQAAFDAAGDIDVLHLTGITACLSDSCCEAVRCAVSLAHSVGATVSFDVNHRRTLPGSRYLADRARELLPALDVLFVGDDELHVLIDTADTSAAIAGLLRTGPQEVVLKRGAEGASTYLPDGSVYTEPARHVMIADVIGAGDSFVAGYLAARSEARPVADRLRWGTICAASTVGTHGDWEGLPTVEELERRCAAPDEALR